MQLLFIDLVFSMNLVMQSVTVLSDPFYISFMLLIAKSNPCFLLLCKMLSKLYHQRCPLWMHPFFWPMTECARPTLGNFIWLCGWTRKTEFQNCWRAPHYNGTTFCWL